MTLFLRPVRMKKREDEDTKNNTNNNNNNYVQMSLWLVGACYRKNTITRRFRVHCRLSRVWRNWKLTDCKRRNARCEVMCVWVCARKKVPASEYKMNDFVEKYFKSKQFSHRRIVSHTISVTISERYYYNNNPYTAQVYVTVWNRKGHYYIFIFELNVNHHKPEIMFAPRHIALECKNEVHELA